MESTETVSKRHVFRDLAMALLAVLSMGPILWVELEGVHWPDPYWRGHWFELPGLVPLFFEAFSWLRLTRVPRAGSSPRC